MATYYHRLHISVKNAAAADVTIIILSLCVCVCVFVFSFLPNFLSVPDFFLSSAKSFICAVCFQAHRVIILFFSSTSGFACHISIHNIILLFLLSSLLCGR